eukprot:Nk52_evm9s372 gene=Nk52_evmTU9s372
MDLFSGVLSQKRDVGGLAEWDEEESPGGMGAMGKTSLSQLFSEENERLKNEDMNLMYSGRTKGLRKEKVEKGGPKSPNTTLEHEKNLSTAEDPKANEPLQLFFATLVNAFRFENGEYLEEGQLGIALMGNESVSSYTLLLYVDQKNHKCSAPIRSDFACSFKDGYNAYFLDERNRQWCVQFLKVEDALRFAKVYLLMKYKLGEAGDYKGFDGGFCLAKGTEKKESAKYALNIKGLWEMEFVDKPIMEHHWSKKSLKELGGQSEKLFKACDKLERDETSIVIVSMDMLGSICEDTEKAYASDRKVVCCLSIEEIQEDPVVESGKEVSLARPPISRKPSREEQLHHKKEMLMQRIAKVGISSLPGSQSNVGTGAKRPLGRKASSTANSELISSAGDEVPHSSVSDTNKKNSVHFQSEEGGLSSIEEKLLQCSKKLDILVNRYGETKSCLPNLSNETILFNVEKLILENTEMKALSEEKNEKINSLLSLQCTSAEKMANLLEKQEKMQNELKLKDSEITEVVQNCSSLRNENEQLREEVRKLKESVQSNSTGLVAPLDAKVAVKQLMSVAYGNIQRFFDADTAYQGEDVHKITAEILKHTTSTFMKKNSENTYPKGE